MNSSDPSNKSNSAPASGPTDTQDLTVFVQSLLEQMQSRFAQMSDAIIGRIDEMGSRIDELEKSIGDLIEQTNEDGNEKNQKVPVSAAHEKVERV